ncbi:stage II sporulation protein M [Salinithrix halophila]|uniref:Stage II sporulation protein M n=1 Tax=Salinithrix halophila TaxID=1485204 RepID=A0ABV8JDS5_9BACL
MGRFLEALRSERRLIWLATLLLVGSAILGYAASESILSVMKNSPMWEQIQETVKAIKRQPDFFHAFQIIFLNNLRAAATMLGLGLFFGVFPMIALVSNGVLLGLVLAIAGQSGANPFFVLVTKILPHGILELPAILIAAAFGIRLGILAARGLVSLFSPALRVQNMQEWQQLFQRIPVVVLGVSVMLIIAAVIESSLIVFLS